MALLFAPGLQAQDWNDADPTALPQSVAHRAYTARLAQSLAKAGSARELALAALLLDLAADARQAESGDTGPARARAVDAEAQVWRRSAAAKAGSDVLANQLLAGAGGAADAALRTAAAQRWQAADPGNLQPLLAAGLEADALLAQARTATRADARMYEGVRWIMSAYRKHPPLAAEQSALAGGGEYHVEEAAAVAAMGLWAATAMPGLATLAEACDPEALRVLPARRDDCLHAARLLADRSGSIGDERLGLSMQHALAASGAERAPVVERLRALDWRMLQWGRIAQQQPRDGAAQFARLLADPGIVTEQQLVARVLAEAGVSPEPPPGWMPPRR